MGDPRQERPADESHTGDRVDSRLLALVTASVNRHIKTAIAPEELSVDEWSVLDHLDDSGACTMSTLAQATGINGATLTRLIDRLVTRALVYRSADRGDRRRVLVHVSERGKATTQRVRPLIIAAEDHLASPLTQSERRELTQLLRRLSLVDTTSGGRAAGHGHDVTHVTPRT